MNESHVIYTRDLPAIVGGKMISGSGNLELRYLSLDSRNVMISTETLFVAVKGVQHDGHAFLSELYAKGIRQFLVENIDTNLPADAEVILISSAVKALHQLAAYKRQILNCPVIGITGSNAKTIIKEQLYQFLSSHYLVLKSPKSYNSQIGVPLSVWGSAPYYDFAIFEAGISRTGEMQNLEPMIRPDVGLFTNIGPAHNEGFASLKQKIEEKLKLFARSERLVYCADHTEVATAVEACTYTFERVSWSRKSIAMYQIPNIVRLEGQFTLYMSGRNKQAVFRMAECDNATLENIIHCLVLGMELGMAQEICKRIEWYSEYSYAPGN